MKFFGHGLHKHVYVSYIYGFLGYHDLIFADHASPCLHGFHQGNL